MAEKRQEVNDLENSDNIKANIQAQCATEVRHQLREWVGGRLLDDLNGGGFL